MGMRTVDVEYPEEALTGGLTEDQIKLLAREALYVKLYEQGAISSGRASHLLGMTRWEFLDLLGRYGVSYLDDTGDLEAEVRRAQP